VASRPPAQKERRGRAAWADPVGQTCRDPGAAAQRVAVPAIMRPSGVPSPFISALKLRFRARACCGLGLLMIGCGAANSGSAATGGAGGTERGGSGSTPNGVGGTTGDVAQEGAPSIGACRVFPVDNAWNRDVSTLPVHASSDAFIDSIGRDEHVHPDFGTEWEGAPIGIPVTSVVASQPDVPVVFEAYADESDAGPYPIPLGASVEGGPDSDGDRHVIAVDLADCKLYELYRAFPRNGAWHADSGAVFDLGENDEHPYTFTSADAAGLPIFPGLVRYEEVVLRGELRHAVRFTVSRSRRALIAPARHYAGAGNEADLPPMGLRLRMKQSHDCTGYAAPARVICDGLKRYGMLVADNGSDWYLSGAPDPRWDDDALGDLKQITGDAFEAVETGPIQTY
jgi:hypothetical protein